MKSSPRLSVYFIFDKPASSYGRRSISIYDYSTPSVFASPATLVSCSAFLCNFFLFPLLSSNIRNYVRKNKRFGKIHSLLLLPSLLVILQLLTLSLPSAKQRCSGN